MKMLSLIKYLCKAIVLNCLNIYIYITFSSEYSTNQNISWSKKQKLWKTEMNYVMHPHVLLSEQVLHSLFLGNLDVIHTWSLSDNTRLIYNFELFTSCVYFYFTNYYFFSLCWSGYLGWHSIQLTLMEQTKLFFAVNIIFVTTVFYYSCCLASCEICITFHLQSPYHFNYTGRRWKSNI